MTLLFFENGVIPSVFKNVQKLNIPQRMESAENGIINSVVKKYLTNNINN